MKRIYIFLFFAGLAINALTGQDLNSAKSLTLSERFEDADAAYTALLKSDPANCVINYYYGENILKEYLNDPYSNSLENVVSEAREIFKQGIAKDSINPLNYIGLGMTILMEKNDTNIANTYFAKAQRTIPKNIKKYTPANIETLIKLGTAELYSAKPRFNRAINYLELAKTVAPENPEVYVALGDVYMAKVDPSNAIANYNSALYYSPNNVMLLVNIGNIYSRARNLNEARSYYEKAQEIDSTFAPIYKGLGEMYSMAGLYAYSKGNFKKFLDLSGNNLPAKVSYVNSLFKTKDFDEVLAQIAEILQIDSSRTYLFRIGGYSAYDSRPGNYPLAKNYLERFFNNATPDKIIAKDYIYYGKTLLKIKEDSAMIDKGFDMLLKGYNMNPEDQDVISELAFNAYYFKKYDLAITMINKKIDNGSANANDYMYLGKTYYQLKDYTSADSIFMKVTVMDPKNIQAYLWAANSYASLGDLQNQKGIAKPKYETVIEKIGTDTVEYVRELISADDYLCSYYLTIAKPADYNKAAYYANELLRKDPTNEQIRLKAYTLLGVIYTTSKEYIKAKAAWQSALALDPKNEEIKKTIEGINKYLAAPKQ